jgi:hypothetical protein
MIQINNKIIENAKQTRQNKYDKQNKLTNNTNNNKQTTTNTLQTKHKTNQPKQHKEHIPTWSTGNLCEMRNSRLACAEARPVSRTSASMLVVPALAGASVNK